MIRNLIILAVATALTACAPTPYQWRDTQGTGREDATADLEYCKEYAAAQYSPGVPAGSSYLGANKAHSLAWDKNQEKGFGEWRPDRDPSRNININTLPTHSVDVDYTGYPGELDYYPDYLDDILGKCMQDRGWAYQPIEQAMTEESSEKASETPLKESLIEQLNEKNAQTGKTGL